MTNPPAERNILFDPERPRKLLKATPLRPIADNAEAGQIALQKGSGCTQREITSLAGDQSAYEDQLKFGVGLGTARVTETQRRSNAVLRYKKHFLAIRGKLGSMFGKRRLGWLPHCDRWSEQEA